MAKNKGPAPSWFRMQAKARKARIEIYDEIGFFGITASDFSRQLNELGEIDEIELHINSPGGAVGDMLAMYNVLRRHEAEVTVFIDGIAASAASVIAMAGDTIIMPSNTHLLIHNPAGFAAGDEGEMRRSAEHLAKITDSIVSIYAGRTGLPGDEIRDMMAEVTLLSAEEAVEKGFADQIEDEIKIAAHFDLSRYPTASKLSKITASAAASGRRSPRRRKKEAAMADKKKSQSKTRCGALIESAITAMATDDYPRDGIVAEIAQEAGITAEQVAGIVAGDAPCESMKEVRAFAATLDGVTKGQIIDALGADGCDTEGLPTERPQKDDKPNNVTNLDDARVHRAATAYTTEVAELCALAGQSDRLSEFVAKKMSVPQVRKTLLDDRAEASGDDVTNQHNGGPAGGKGGDMWRRVLAKRGVLKEQAKAG